MEEEEGGEDRKEEEREEEVRKRRGGGKGGEEEKEERRLLVAACDRLTDGSAKNPASTPPSIFTWKLHKDQHSLHVIYKQSKVHNVRAGSIKSFANSTKCLKSSPYTSWCLSFWWPLVKQSLNTKKSFTT